MGVLVYLTRSQMRRLCQVGVVYFYQFSHEMKIRYASKRDAFELYSFSSKLNKYIYCCDVEEPVLYEK